MIYIKGDLTKSDESIIAHGVNCQAVMGSGVAKAIRAKWPRAYNVYMAYLDYKPNGRVLGEFCYVKDEGTMIVNLFTQEYYGRDGKRYASKPAIESSLRRLLDSMPRIRGMYRIAIPKIGCGLGGLDWESEVKPVLEYLETQYSVNFAVYEL